MGGASGAAEVDIEEDGRLNCEPWLVTLHVPVLKATLKPTAILLSVRACILQVRAAATASVKKKPVKVAAVSHRHVHAEAPPEATNSQCSLSQVRMTVSGFAEGV